MIEINDHEGGSRSALDTSSGPETNWSRKLLTAKRSLIVNINALITNLRVASASHLSDRVAQFEDIKSVVEDYKKRANNIRDPNVSQLLEKGDFYFEKCRKTLDSATGVHSITPTRKSSTMVFNRRTVFRRIKARFLLSVNYWHIR